MDTQTLTIKEARAALDAKEYSAVDLAQACLDQIAKQDGELHAFLEVYDDVIEQAKAADARIATGDVASLTGIPLAIKDNILIEGCRASAGSKILENYEAPYDATVITKLKEQGAVLLGRTNMDEFALGSSTENSAYGPTRNPHDTERIPGGTSGGSAAAVAAGMALAALGTDTGGSIRQPSALCGVVGLKPTYGAVSRSGVIAAASSLDQVGSIARTAEDAEILFNAIMGHDPMDSTSLRTDAPEFAAPKTIGVPRAFLREGVDPDVLERFESSLSALAVAGYTIKDIELPSFEYALAVYYIVNPAEVSTNLARFDGIRYGASVAADTIREVYEESRAQGFGTETRRRILTGTFVLSSGYVDAYYRRAIAVRQVIRDDFARAFAEVDAIAMPTSPVPAWKLGEKSDPLAMYAADIFTVPVSLAGVPALSVPMGTVARDQKALPVGLQLVGPHQSEKALFALARAVELQ